MVHGAAYLRNPFNHSTCPSCSILSLAYLNPNRNQRVSVLVLLSRCHPSLRAKMSAGQAQAQVHHPVQYDPSRAYVPPPIPVDPTLKDGGGPDFPQSHNPRTSEKTTSKGDGFCRGLYVFSSQNCLLMHPQRAYLYLSIYVYISI